MSSRTIHLPHRECQRVPSEGQRVMEGFMILLGCVFQSPTESLMQWRSAQKNGSSGKSFLNQMKGWISDFWVD